MTKNRLAVALCATVLAAAGCAARQPVLYPNDHYAEAGRRAAERDIAACSERAEAYDRVPVADGARSTVIASGTGAAVGAAGGAIWGGAARGAAAGAAGGAAAGILHALVGSREPSATYKSYVATCLNERGYAVIGWE